MSGHRVLVVDDSDVTRALLRRFLESAGFVVGEAGDGAEAAVEALRDTPDAVVTDLEMAVMDGHQLARLLKNDTATAHLPVVILTSHDEATARFWGLRTGADAYVTKDRLEEVLVPTLERLIARAPQPRAGTERPPGGPLEVLARVVRHLDTNLLEATLTTSLLEIGMRNATLGAACQALLEVVEPVVGARLLAVAVAETETVEVHCLSPDGGADAATLERAAAALAALFPGDGERTVTVSSAGSLATNPVPPLGELAHVPLALRDAGGCLAVWPSDWDAFREQPLGLLAKMAPQVALVVDNARLAERLWELSTLDGLTRLLNHRAVLERLTEELARAGRYGPPMSVALCDIDRFKIINDTHGHLVGDAILRDLAQRLRSGVRQVDVVGRYGGEEFLLILPASELADACVAIHRLCQRLAAEPVQLEDGREVTVTASFGVASSSEVDHPRAIERLLGLADDRLYQAKAAGRSCVKP